MVGQMTKKSAYLAAFFAAALSLTSCMEVGITPEVPNDSDEETTTTAAEKDEETTTTAAEKDEETTTTAAEKDEETTTTAAEKDEETTTTAAKKTPTTAADPAAPKSVGDNAKVAMQKELVDELNVRRAEMGLKPVAFDQSIADSATECSIKSMKQRELEHCAYEVLWAGGGPSSRYSAQDLLESWWNSPLHKKALTHPTSTKAGGAFVYQEGGDFSVGAIEITIR